MVWLTLFFVGVLVVGFLVVYALDNPNFMAGFRQRLSLDQQQEPQVQEEMVTVADPQADPGQERLGLAERIRQMLDRDLQQEEPELAPRIEVPFYYAVLGEDLLLGSEKRIIVAGSKENALVNAVKELLKGPTRSYLFPVIPGGTTLIHTEIHENIATIDLSQEFLDNSLDTRILDELIIYSMVNTVTEIPGIDGVIFYIDGKRIKVYGDIDLSIPAIRNEALIREQGV